MKVYPVNPATFITEPITDAQRSALSVLARYYPEVSQVKTKAQATRFISDHIFEYHLICDMQEMMYSGLYFGLND